MKVLYTSIRDTHIIFSSSDGFKLDWFALDTAVALTVVDGSANLDLHVTRLAPSSTPRVTHDPVVLASGCITAPTDNVGRVIERSAAFRVVEDTT